VSLDLQNGSQKLLLTTKESIVFNCIFSGPPCRLKCISFKVLLKIHSSGSSTSNCRC